MTSIELRMARLTRFGFTVRQARVLVLAGYDLFYVRSEAVGL